MSACAQYVTYCTYSSWFKKTVRLSGKPIQTFADPRHVKEVDKGITGINEINVELGTIQ